jgi:hypothetical protein
VEHSSKASGVKASLRAEVRLDFKSRRIKGFLLKCGDVVFWDLVLEKAQE